MQYVKGLFILHCCIAALCWINSCSQTQWDELPCFSEPHLTHSSYHPLPVNGQPLNWYWRCLSPGKGVSTHHIISYMYPACICFWPRGYRGIPDVPMSRGGTKGLNQWTTGIIIDCVYDTMTQLTSHQERGTWVAGHYLATFKYSSSVIDSIQQLMMLVHIVCVSVHLE